MSRKNGRESHLVRVHVVEVRGLRGLDTSHMSDAVCIVSLGPTARMKKSTETKPSTVNCVWERVFLFEDVMMNDEEFEREKVSLGVFDRNFFTRNELIGSYEFSLANVYRQKGHEYHRKWVPLTQPNDPAKMQGFLLVSIYVLKENDPTPSHEILDEEAEEKEVLTMNPPVGERRLYILNVLIYKAKDLAETHTLIPGAPNPFISVRFNGNTIQTKKMANLSNPLWNTKMEMPFHLPLASDSVEIQAWNYVKGRQDKLIGSRTFSYFKLRLTHRPWGPEWVNLYSPFRTAPETSFLGNLRDKLAGAGKRGDPSEYVGRVLCRLSVSPVETFGFNPRLVARPCNPTAEPPGEEYTLHMVLYSASEVPVMGGKVKVELAFGSQRIVSKPVLGRNGVFVWNTALEPIFMYAPVCLHQVHDVIINVYHVTGLVSRKIAFERLKVHDLFPNNKYFWINGETRLQNEWSAWQPRWRALRHVFPSEDHKHIIPGFLLCSIGFGFRKVAPVSPPKLVHHNPRPYTLRCRIRHAANLPPADAMSSANPALVIRCGGRSLELPTLEDTTFPMWYREAELDIQLDPRNIEHAPSVFLLVYHKEFSASLLGRSEVMMSDIQQNPDRLYRFPLYTEQNPQLSEEQLDQFDQQVPYVLASFRLVKKMADGGKGTKVVDEEEVEEVVAEEPNQPRWDEPEARYFALKLETIGLRKIQGFSFSRLRKPQLRLDFPALPGSGMDAEPPVILPCPAPQGGSIHLQEMAHFSKIALGSDNLFSVPLRIRLVDDRPTGPVLVGGTTVPVASFIEGTVEKPPFYISHRKKTDREMLDLEGARELEQVFEEEKKEEEEKRMAGLPKEIREKLKRGTRKLHPDLSKAPHLSLGQEDANVTLICAPEPTDGRDEQNLNLLAKAQEQKEAMVIENELELRKQNLGLEANSFHEFTLWRGRWSPADLSRHDVAVFNQKGRGLAQGARLKCFVRVTPHEQDALVLQDDLLAPFREMYETPFVCRLYIYRALNLTPKDRVLMGQQTSNPYLVISNGKGPDHHINDRVNAQGGNLNPMFFQVFELRATLPHNNDLSVSVWDHDVVKSDDLIGTTNIDLEWRMLHGMKNGGMEFRMLKAPGSDISHGKIQMRLDILTEDEARRIRPDDLRMPHNEMYELRMVIWNTRNIRFPEDKDMNKSVDQKIYVTANFNGDVNGDIIKQTDTAWYSSGGTAEWNWRMKWKLRLPCKVPRLKLSVWDENLTGEDESIGEIIYNLNPFFQRALRERKPVTTAEHKWIDFKHPNYRGKDLGQVNIELWLYTETEAQQFEVGEAQDEPNRLPFLPDPKRNPPPWAVGTRGLDWLQKRKRLMMCICVCMIILPFVILKVSTSYM